MASINLTALTDNITQLIALNPGRKVVSVVKADAYGNGANVVAKTIEPQSDILAVAFLEEAKALRQAGLTKPILILQGAHTEQDFSEGEPLNLIWMIHSDWQLRSYAQYIQKTGTQANAWFKFDTGMHRLGLNCATFADVMRTYAALFNHNTVIVTHLASADEPIQTHAKQQIARFLDVVKGTDYPLCIANSAASIRFEDARQDFVRLGIAMYGASPFQAHDNPIELRPVMSLNSQIIAIRSIPSGDTVGYGGTWTAAKPSLIATVALGYADGYPRHAPIGTPAWCNGQHIHLVGRVSMDMLTFDVSHMPDAKIGDKVQLWGDKLPINEIANYIGTIGYELMTRVSYRVPREYITDNNC